MIRVDSKLRKVDLSQRSEEERAADKKMAEKGAGTVKVSGMNSLQAALARAGVQKTDFVDLSEVRLCSAFPCPCSVAFSRQLLLQACTAFPPYWKSPSPRSSSCLSPCWNPSEYGGD